LVNTDTSKYIFSDNLNIYAKWLIVNGDYIKTDSNQTFKNDVDESTNIDQEIELLKAQKVYHGDYFDDITELNLARKSRLSGDATIGIKPLLLKYGAIDGSNNGETPADRNELLKALEKVIEQIQEGQNKSSEKGKILIDYIREVAPESADALAENGFKFRQRMIGKYVLDQMTKRVKELSKKTTMTGLGGGDDEEEGAGFEFDSGAMVSRSSSDTYDTGRQRVSASDLPSGKIVSPGGVLRVAGGIKKVKTTSGLRKPSFPTAIKKDDATQANSAQGSPTSQVQSTQDLPTTSGLRKPSFPTAIKKDIRTENFGINLLSYNAWKKIQETIGTYAIVSKKPKDGDGYNIWGSLGDISGVSITGDADTSKIDPIGKKGNKIVKRKR
jgi:hypothetical protein